MKYHLVIFYNNCLSREKYLIIENHREMFKTNSKYELKIELDILGFKIGKYRDDKTRCRYFNTKFGGIAINLEER